MEKFKMRMFRVYFFDGWHTDIISENKVNAMDAARAFRIATGQGLEERISYVKPL